MSQTVLNNVYNHYLTAYAPKSTTRFDTHKKSELRNVYTSIVKMNKDAPWYLPDTSEDTRVFAIGLKENARALRNTIVSLGGLESESLLNKKAAFSSDENIVTASFLGNSTGEATPSFHIEVTALAQGQENRGTYLPDAPVKLPPDTYSFDIAINDLNYEFQFSIKEEETNRDVQERLARLITNSNIGITAEVTEHEGISSLKLNSTATGLPFGKETIFRVSDDHTSKAEGTVAYFGLDYVSRQPSNASFLLNGEERSVASNQFTVGGMYEVTLHSISAPGEEVSIGLKTDTDSLTENVNELLSGYNDFIRAASEYTEKHPRSKQLIHELKAISSLYQTDMENIGIQMQEDGSLVLDSKIFRQETRDDENLNRSLSSVKDFAGALLRKSGQISLNPMNYVDKTIVAYKNPGHNFASPYVTSAYSGMMFNSYC